MGSQRDPSGRRLLVLRQRTLKLNLPYCLHVYVRGAGLYGLHFGGGELR